MAINTNTDIFNAGITLHYLEARGAVIGLGEDLAYYRSASEYSFARVEEAVASCGYFQMSQANQFSPYRISMTAQADVKIITQDQNAIEKIERQGNEILSVLLEEYGYAGITLPEMPHDDSYLWEEDDWH